MPIPGDHPSGESLRYEGAYDRIAEARREDDPSVTRGVWKSALKRSDWDLVETLCEDALNNRTKDLQIAAWLLEAWLHLYRFEGVEEGLDLLRELCVRFWDDLHPQIVDGDIDYRIAPITWVNEKLLVPLKLLPVTSPASSELPTYSWSDWENACRTEVGDPRLRSASSAAQPPKLTPAEFQQSAVATPTDFFVYMAAKLEGAIKAALDLGSVLDKFCGKQAPSLSQFRGLMESIHAFAAGVLAQRQHEDLSSLLEATESPVVPNEHEFHSAAFSGSPITGRDEAYRRLAEAAEYLARTEPHSPAPYLIRRAIQWGSLSLPELLPELVRNQTELNEIFRLLQLGETGKPEK